MQLRATTYCASHRPPPRTNATRRCMRCHAQAERGATLRTAMLQAGVTPHNGRASLINCRGLGTCGTCAVEIRGEVEPREWTTQESLRLNFPPHGAPGNQRLRLACQVRSPPWEWLPACLPAYTACCTESR